MAAWRVPRMWEGSECWIIGGGPSIHQEFDVPPDVAEKITKREIPLSTLSPYMEAIHHKHVIGVNLAFRIGAWIDVVFFGDASWYLFNKKQLAAFSGLKVSCAPRFANWPKDHPERIKYLRKGPKYGLSKRPTEICFNTNSGAAAISLAYQFGATRIILLGFDMQKDEDNNTHWHGYHVEKTSGMVDRRGNKKSKPKNSPFRRHLRCFPVIAAQAQAEGIEIINASQNSVITQFPKKTVKELL